jgi:hypothetical protein
MSEPPKYFSDKDDHSPFLKALAEVRRIGVHEGWCYHHVRAILLPIDQCASGNHDLRSFCVQSRSNCWSVVNIAHF